MTYSFEAIGYLESCYQQKFGIPRQSGLIPDADSRLKLPLPLFNESTRGIEGFSHLWILFVFHAHLKEGKWKNLVRPPRLGGEKKVGVFASRSSFRPNPIGLSLVELFLVEEQKDFVILHLRGGDFLEGTPVLDIKPYLPYADQKSPVRTGWVTPDKPVSEVEVSWDSEVLQKARTLGLEPLIAQLIAQDPRSAQDRKSPPLLHYATQIRQGEQIYDIHWQMEGNQARVIELFATRPSRGKS